MSITIHVDAYSGYRANERPRRFWLDAQFDGHKLKGVHEIAEVEGRWYEPDAIYFRVRSIEGKRYILRYNEHEDRWALQSGFDGDELLARPSIELVAADPSAVRRAESEIAGCERCRESESDIPFDWILADVLGKHGSFDFVLSETGRCPNCKGELSEKTLVEPQGGLELEAPQWT